MVPPPSPPVNGVVGASDAINVPGYTLETHSWKHIIQSLPSFTVARVRVAMPETNGRGVVRTLPMVVLVTLGRVGSNDIAVCSLTSAFVFKERVYYTVPTGINQFHTLRRSEETVQWQPHVDSTACFFPMCVDNDAELSNVLYTMDDASFWLNQ